MTVHTSRSSGLGLGNEELTTWSRGPRSPTSARCRWFRRTHCRIGNGYTHSGFFTPDRKHCATPADP